MVLEIATLDENTVGPLNTIGEWKYLPKRPFAVIIANGKMILLTKKQ